MMINNTEMQLPTNSYKIIYYLYMAFAFYFLIGIYANSHEGIWEILYQLSFSMVFLSIIVATYFIFQKMRQGNDSVLADIRSDILVIIFLAIILFLGSFEFKQSFYAVFEPTKTAMADEYTTQIKDYRGTKQYYLFFDDKENPNSCDSHIQKCKYQYKVRINSGTYQQINNKQQISKDNPLKIFYKPKAEILMKWEAI
nr:hypothetical protein [Moraxella sp. CTOTU48841]